MSRTKKGKKAPGFDYWSRRPGNASFCNSPGDGVKQLTHRLERRISKREIEKATGEEWQIENGPDGEAHAFLDRADAEVPHIDYVPDFVIVEELLRLAAECERLREGLREIERLTSGEYAMCTSFSRIKERILDLLGGGA